jgi:cell wall-associated NlpC family hydrolase
MTVYAADVTRLALTQVGDRYVYGAEVSHSDPNPKLHHKPLDCSEFTEWDLNRLGIKMPDGSANQYTYCKRYGKVVSVAQAIKTQGALLYHPGHIAISLGNGSTIEAKGKAYGVGKFSASGRGWTAGLLIPHVVYGAPPKPPTVSSTVPRWPGRYLTQPPMMVLTAAETKIQTRLRDLGLYHGRIDSRYGPMTEEAVDELQRRKGLRQDGVVGDQTWYAAFRG